MTKYSLSLDKTSINGMSGHHTVHCHIIEREGEEVVHGIAEDYGIDPLALQSRHSGDIKLWLAQVGKEMLEKHQRRQLAHGELIKMRGSEIDIPE